MRAIRQIRSGWGQQQNPPWLTSHSSGRAGIENHPGPLLERYRDAQVTAYLHLPAGGAGHQELAGCQRTDRLSQHVG
jgi:hypothetical protein